MKSSIFSENRDTPGVGEHSRNPLYASGVAAVATQARRKNLKLSWALIGFLFLGTSWACFALPNAGPVVARLESKAGILNAAGPAPLRVTIENASNISFFIARPFTHVASLKNCDVPLAER